MIFFKKLTIIILVTASFSFLIWMLFVTKTEDLIISNRDEIGDDTKIQDLFPVKLTEATVSFGDETKAKLFVPEGFSINVSAEDLGKARFMTKSPDGRIFIPDMVDYSLSHEGRIVILDDFNEETKEFSTQHTYLSDLRGPHNVAFYTDKSGNDWIYITLTKNLIRYPYSDGDTSPQGEPEVIYEFPNTQSEDAEGVVWHITRTVYFDGDQMYVSIGSGCNLCEESPDEDRAVILIMDPEGNSVRTYAEGIKNAVGLAIVNGTLYATENGTDHLGDDAPDDTLFRVKEGAHYGWPYCYEVDGEKYEDISKVWGSRQVDCDTVPTSFAFFDPHSAPLGVTYFENSSTESPILKNTFLVALQGSWNPEIGTGYQIVRVREDGQKDVFIDGFMDENNERVGRPVHILIWDEKSFFITEDYNGRMYYVQTLE